VLDTNGNISIVQVAVLKVPETVSLIADNSYVRSVTDAAARIGHGQNESEIENQHSPQNQEQEQMAEAQQIENAASVSASHRHTVAKVVPVKGKAKRDELE